MTPQTPQGAALSDADIENCIDNANRKFNSRRQGPSGQQITSYDDWKHWLAREVEHTVRAADRRLTAEQPEDTAEKFIQAAIDSAPEPLRRLGEYLARVLDEDQWATAERMLLGLTAEQPVGKFWCESCDGTGKIDERLTAYSDSNPAAECPDCDGNGWWQSARAPVTAEQGGALAALLQELREATDLEGFGCACEPNVQCGACKARSVMFKLVTPLVNKYAALTQPQAEPAAWVSIKDRTPQDWSAYLVCNRSGDVEVAVYQFKDGGLDGRKAGRWYLDNDDNTFPATHWMPLPDTPTAPTEPT